MKFNDKVRVKEVKSVKYKVGDIVMAGSSGNMIVLITQWSEDSDRYSGVRLNMNKPDYSEHWNKCFITGLYEGEISLYNEL